MRDTATLPESLGGELRSALMRAPAYWVDCLGMIRQRHPDVAEQLTHQLEGHMETPFLQAAASEARALRGVMGLNLHLGSPQESDLLDMNLKTLNLEATKHGSTKPVSRVERPLRDEGLFVSFVWRFIENSHPLPGWIQSRVGTIQVSNVPHHEMGPCLRMRLSLTVRNCLPLDACGHHCSAWARLGCWAGGVSSGKCCCAHLPRSTRRVSTNVMLRDLNLAMPNAVDGRRREVVVDGLPLFGWSQRAVDTLVSALQEQPMRMELRLWLPDEGWI